MRRSIWTLLFALTLCLPLGLHAKAAKHVAPEDASTTAFNTRTAKVLEVNQEKHTIALEGEGGTRLEFKVDPAKVKNFSQIKKGDLVVVNTTKSWALSLTKGAKGEKPSADMITTKETAPVGSKPGMDQTQTSQISAEVVKVDVSKSMVELKGPEGNVVELQVKDPKNLEGVKKGDMVTATYTVSMAISVEAAPK